jgi:hypothetical protein
MTLWLLLNNHLLNVAIAEHNFSLSAASFFQLHHWHRHSWELEVAVLHYLNSSYNICDWSITCQELTLVHMIHTNLSPNLQNMPGRKESCSPHFTEEGHRGSVVHPRWYGKRKSHIWYSLFRDQSLALTKRSSCPASQSQGRHGCRRQLNPPQPSEDISCHCESQWCDSSPKWPWYIKEDNLNKFKHLGDDENNVIAVFFAFILISKIVQMRRLHVETPGALRAV